MKSTIATTDYSWMKVQEPPRVSLYFDILTDFKIRHNNPLQKSDWEILTRMSDRDRLWYVTVAHMAQVIKQNLGLETLIETIRIGPDDFFKTYHDSL